MSFVCPRCNSADIKFDDDWAICIDCGCHGEFLKFSSSVEPEAAVARKNKGQWKYPYIKDNLKRQP